MHSRSMNPWFQIVLAVVLLGPFSARLQAAETLFDPSFRLDPTISGAVETVRVRSNGRLLVGGKMTLGESNRVLLVQLLPDGTLDPSFQSLPFDWAYQYGAHPVDVLPLADGGILVSYAQAPTDASPPISSLVFRLSADGKDRVTWPYIPAAIRLTSATNGQVMAWGEQVWRESTAAYRQGFLQQRSPGGEWDRSFDLTGITLQVKPMELPRRIESLAVCANGDFLLSGRFGAWEPSTDDALPFLARITSKGNLLWLSSRRDIRESSSQVHELKSGRILYTSTIDGLIRFEADGRRDTGQWKPPALSPTSSLVLQDGRLLLAGAFSQVEGMARSNLVCLLDDGRLDLRFDPGSSFGGLDPGSVVGMAQQDDGRILVAGNFTSFDGNTARGLVRLFPENPGSSSSASVLQYRVEKPAAECGAPFKLLLIRSGDSNQFHQVRILTEPGSAKDGEDFVPVDTVVRFLPGEVFHSVVIPVIHDRQAEGPETFSVRLESDSVELPVAGVNPLQVVIQEPDCRVSFDTNVLSVVEGDPAQLLETGFVNVFNPSGLPVRVRTRDLTAHSGSDYQSIDQVVSQSTGLPI